MSNSNTTHVLPLILSSAIVALIGLKFLKKDVKENFVSFPSSTRENVKKNITYDDDKEFSSTKEADTFFKSDHKKNSTHQHHQNIMKMDEIDLPDMTLEEEKQIFEPPRWLPYNNFKERTHEITFRGDLPIPPIQGDWFIPSTAKASNLVSGINIGCENDAIEKLKKNYSD